MKKQAGFSLLEVLITMLIVSFGLLGIAGIVITSLKNTQGSYARSQASLLANDIIDRMRANRAVAEAAPSPYNLTLTADPTGTGVVFDDLDQWRSALRTSIAAGTGSVNVDATSKKVTVTVQWDDSHATADTAHGVGSSAQQVVVETRL
ncbi:MAG: pilV [Massilia sp.]|jgi:type IV pilus assembly protein PilV|nr:pilV [Massilia sp.]